MKIEGVPELPGVNAVPLPASPDRHLSIERAARLAWFARSVLDAWAEGHDLDGGDIQDLAERHGLIFKTAFNPEVHEDFHGVGVQPGDEWFMPAGWLIDFSRSVPNVCAGDEPLNREPGHGG